MNRFGAEQARGEDNGKDFPGPDWYNEMDGDATQRDEKPRRGVSWLKKKKINSFITSLGFF